MAIITNLNNLVDITVTEQLNGLFVPADGGTDGTNGTNGLLTDSDKFKLDTIESGATTDQTANEILALLKTVDGSDSELDADLLDGLNSNQFLRSDTNTSLNGNLSITGTVDGRDISVDGVILDSLITIEEV